MRRPAHQEKTLERLVTWRTQRPDLAVRSTFIVGFPGETEDDFKELLDWLSAARLARVGCFKYEDVDGAPAHALPDQVPEEVKEERYARLMAHQQVISAEVLAARVGETLEVIVDDVDDEGAIARSTWDAPEIDGNVFIDDGEGLQPGDRLMATVTDASEYDLWATPLRQLSKRMPSSYCPSS
jgi:ribosomal protein S12 methylthiotransferase